MFPTSAQGSQALDTLLHGSSYINLSINEAVDRYAQVLRTTLPVISSSCKTLWELVETLRYPP